MQKLHLLALIEVGDLGPEDLLEGVHIDVVDRVFEEVAVGLHEQVAVRARFGQIFVDVELFEGLDVGV